MNKGKIAAGLSVIHAGVKTLVHDLGRYGVATMGLSQGGPMDLKSHCWANHLLDNDPNDAVLEITVGQVSFKAESDVWLALTGAEMQARVDGVKVHRNSSFLLEKGKVLKLGYAVDGVRAYLAVRGGFQIKNVLGSVSTVERNGVGGLSGDGKPLQEGDLLEVQVDHAGEGISRRIPLAYDKGYEQNVVLRVILSYQYDYIGKKFLEYFFNTHYRVSSQYDRMGVRLEGDVTPTELAGVVSEGIALGAVQVTPNGQPIVLLNDRQTLGGYPKIGCVARVDLPKLAQLREGAEVKFVKADVGTMSAEWREFCDFFRLNSDGL